MLLRPRVLASFALIACGAGLVVPLQVASAAMPAYSVTSLHFEVKVGPAGDQSCDVVGDLYTPTAASSLNRMPAILTTNGFGGSKADQAGIGATYANHGYVVLAYSGLGFGGSSCKITLDDPAFDGAAGKQLVSYLGGAAGIAFLDPQHTQPVPALSVVKLDGPDDPRVGMLGGSYGGGAQFATAATDPRVDTIVPMITWNDLPYSIDPNNTAHTTGVTSSTPGALKFVWASAFSAVGMTADVQNKQVPPDVLPCPNFADWVCPGLLSAAATGYFPSDTIANGHRASVASYLAKIRIPTLLVQGEYDTLFNLNEAIATYKALRAQRTPVKMIWDAWSHGHPAAPGEFDIANPDPSAQYVSARIMAWCDHYLKGSSVGTGPQFAYFRDWVSYTGIATPAYGTAPSFPIGTPQTWNLSGDSTLTAGTPKPGSQSFVTVPAGLPTSLNPLNVLANTLPLPTDQFVDLPGTFAAWTTPTLSTARNVVGSPVLHLHVMSPTAALTQAAGPAGQLVLFVKIADVASDGTARLINGLEAPIRITDVNAPFTVTLPAIAHQFAAGHKLELVLAGGSINFRGGTGANLVSVTDGPEQTLTIPIA